MSSDIAMIYSVPLDELRTLPGSRNTALPKLIAKEFSGRDEIDEMFSEDYPGEPKTLVAAVRHILAAKPFRQDRGSLYGYAVEALCWSIGSSISLPMGFPGYPAIDKYLTAKGSPVTLEKLMFSGFPLTIPEPEDYPMAGVWEPTEVLAMSEFLAKLKTPRGKLKVGLEAIRDWVAEAVKHETDGLVGFWY
jgi:hypothetical protein